jgi:hypothetical protein
MLDTNSDLIWRPGTQPPQPVPSDATLEELRRFDAQESFNDMMAIMTAETRTTIGIGSFRQVSHDKMMDFWRTSPILREKAVLVLRGIQKPCFIPCLKKHVGLHADNDEGNTACPEAMCILNFIQILRFAPAKFTSDTCPVFHTQTDYARRYPTSPELAGRIPGSDLSEPHPIGPEERIAGEFIEEDINRALVLGGLTVARFSRGSIFHYKRPATKKPNPVNFGYRHPDLNSSMVKKQKGDLPDVFSSITVLQLEQMRQMAELQDKRLTREMEEVNRSMARASADSGTMPLERQLPYYDPAAEAQRQHDQAEFIQQQPAKLGLATRIDYWTALAESNSVEPANAPSRQSSGAKIAEELPPITSKAMEAIIENASRVHGPMETQPVIDRTLPRLTDFSELIELEEREEFVQACLKDELYKAIIRRGEYTEPELRSMLEKAFTLDRVMNDIGHDGQQTLADFCQQYKFEDWPRTRLWKGSPKKGKEPRPHQWISKFTLFFALLLGSVKVD